MIVGLLVGRQMNKDISPSTEHSMEHVDGGVPSVPVRPQDVPQFEKDMNKFIENENSEQARKLEQIQQ